MAVAASSVTRYCRFFHVKHIASVLDYGAGTLRNARFLAKEGFTVYAADIPGQVERILSMAGHERMAAILDVEQLERTRLAVDLVVSTYVFNIIPDPSEKSRYLRNVRLNLRPGGYLLIEVRCRIQSPDCGTRCTFAHKCSSCVKTYSHQELDDLVAAYGFRRFSHYYCRHAVAVLYQLQNA
ncbi:class I SAM-dependent methyltransferase [Geomesophilobacter sediminis]|uniref:Class I SAM-dependent methyltransferase n=1 Tax=Geomesophilobacter sediminis TaxID=2798584 RepID=A0A8J7IWQ5_9BACT|nr:class I SAM-dependent methyltransferase [Geomesophilobacter sediminis]MBJ6724022.1 class I SAM-dependent methyltransferase [Geomesophilobacter sediminis]